MREAAVDLHHLGEQIEGHLSDRAADLPKLSLFHERELLGDAGAPTIARRFPAGKDLLLGSDSGAAPDFESLSAHGCDPARVAPLRVLKNREPARQTPLQAEGNRIASFRRQTNRPLLDGSVVVVSPRLLRGTRPGEGSLVEDLREPLLGERREEVGWVRCRGASAVLGCPGDFVGLTLEPLDRGGPFPRASRNLDPDARVLSLIAETRWRARPRDVAVGQPLTRGGHGVHPRSPRR